MANRNFKLYSVDSGFNFQEFIDFAEDFGKKRKNFKDFLRRWLKKQAEYVIAEAEERTPIDTGELLKGWQPAEVHIQGNDMSIYFINDTYYSSWVEYGHAKPYKGIGTPGTEDWVEGRFMLTVPLQKFIDDLPKEFEAAFWKYMGA